MNIETTFIIDDDPIFILGTKILLKKSDFSNSIEVCNNGQEAILFIENMLKKAQSLPEIIFLDLNMPVMDGWEFLDALSKLFSKLKAKIYILSSSIDSRDLERAKKYGLVTGFISKPLTKSILTELKLAL